MSSLVYGNGPIKIDFDDPKLSGDGGLMLVSAMFERLGVAETAQRWVNVQGDGSANVGPKLETLVATMIAGGCWAPRPLTITDSSGVTQGGHEGWSWWRDR